MCFLFVVINRAKNLNFCMTLMLKPNQFQSLFRISSIQAYGGFVVQDCVHFLSYAALKHCVHLLWQSANYGVGFIFDVV